MEEIIKHLKRMTIKDVIDFVVFAFCVFFWGTFLWVITP